MSHKIQHKIHVKNPNARALHSYNPSDPGGSCYKWNQIHPLATGNNRELECWWNSMHRWERRWVSQVDAGVVPGDRAGVWRERYTPGCYNMKQDHEDGT